MASNRESNWQRLQELAQLEPPPPKDAAKYSGDLGRPLRKDQVPGELATRWEALYEWHGVAPGDRDSLLLKLVETHVPGFRMSRVGRPATRERSRALATALERVVERDTGEQWEKRSAGRPRALTPERARKLIDLADAWKAQQARAGVKRASDRGFVLYLCREHAVRNNLRPAAVAKEHAGKTLKQLYAARRRFPKS